eukprot:4590942-Prymnesium_polylepis.1
MPTTACTTFSKPQIPTPHGTPRATPCVSVCRVGDCPCRAGDCPFRTHSSQLPVWLLSGALACSARAFAPDLPAVRAPPVNTMSRFLQPTHSRPHATKRPQRGCIGALDLTLARAHSAYAAG